ncbi:MAG TPA: enoyl-CoA hydratase/isomerase family protein [Geminicoccaceae bacterium]|nr:enoyl-CoA hydratase/isomerase family protein [Geminicoccaceae bacterium]
MSGAAAAGDEIRFACRGELMVVTLNRPQALNALTLSMCRALDEGLRAWQADPTIGAVLIKGAGERAFCAGGDIRWLYHVLTTQGVAAAVRFYAVEYPMNARLHHFGKPWIALLDGITMGGGVGVSVHGSHRIVTGRTMVAMPETGIGMFPDVGATFMLPRLPGALGLYLGLTGARLGAADCLHAGIGTAHVASDRLEALEAALAETPLRDEPFAAVDGVLARFRSDPGPAPLAELRPRIDACFGRQSLAAVLAALADETSGWGAAQARELAQKSPTSLAVTFRQLCKGATLDFDSAMRLEYRLVHRCMAGHDFREGVRALLIDKDQHPRWCPDRLDDVSDAMVDDYFAPLPDGELALGQGGAGA